jgi:hypothetical protein
MLRCLLIFVVIAAIAAPSASAGWKIDRAQAIAAIVWQNPCDGAARLAWAAPPGGEATIAAWTYPTTDDCTVYVTNAAYRDPSNGRDPLHARSDKSIMSAWFDNDRRCRHRGRPYLERHDVLAPRTRR